MKKRSKYDYLQFGSEPKNAWKQGLDIKQDRNKKEGKEAYPWRPMDQQLLVWETVLLSSEKQLQVVGMDGGGVYTKNRSKHRWLSGPEQRHTADGFENRKLGY